MDKIERLLNFLIESPDDCFVLHALGLEYLKIDDLNKAIFYFENVLSKNSNYVGTYYHLAKAYEIMNDENKALEIYKKGIEIADSLQDKHAKAELETALWELE